MASTKCVSALHSRARRAVDEVSHRIRLPAPFQCRPRVFCKVPSDTLLYEVGSIKKWPLSRQRRVPLAARLRDEERDPPCGPSLVLRVRRIRCDSESPEPCPLGCVLDLADPHRLHRGVVADLDGRVGAQVVYPDRVRGCPAHGPDEDIVGAILYAHQWGLADGAGLVASMGHDDHRQSGVAERGAVGPTTALVELDLVTHPLSGTGNVLCHEVL